MTAPDAPTLAAADPRHAVYTRPQRKGARWRLHGVYATAEESWRAGLDLRGVDVWFSTLADQARVPPAESGLVPIPAAAPRV